MLRIANTVGTGLCPATLQEEIRPQTRGLEIRLELKNGIRIYS